jgi:hypothetical protein
MTPKFPVSSVPNLQAYPENGFPVSAYYGIDSTLAGVNGMSPSSSATGGTASLMPQPATPNQFRDLVIVFGLVIGAVVLWHYYMK